MVRITVQSTGNVGREIVSRVPAAVRQVEAAVLRSCDPYVPYRTGNLLRSGYATGAGTRGEVIYSAPYARECYYADRPFNKKHHPRATARWFEAAKAADLASWIRAAAEGLTTDRAERPGAGESNVLLPR